MNTIHQIYRIAIVTTVLLAANSADAATPSGNAPAAPATRQAPPRLQLLDDAHHRAIFCGGDGTETGAAYARVLARDLRRLEATGCTTAQSLAWLQRRACGGAGSAP